MLTNLHTHTSFCDGKNTVEEMVRAAIEMGFSSLGFSGHAKTDISAGYCMRDPEGYIDAVLAAKEKYKKEIDIFLGIEEEAHSPVDRSRFDYIIGSLHYYFVGGEHFPVDSSREKTQRAIDALGGDPLRAAEVYFEYFTDYILRRKPDVIGHFDLLTKFDEMGEPFFLGTKGYAEMARKYLEMAAASGCIFEVNTGAISRGYRKTPYPTEDLLHLIKKLYCKIALTSDCHAAENLTCAFEETRALLREVGFGQMYALTKNGFEKPEI